MCHTVGKDLPTHTLQHERVRHNNWISGRICKVCISFDNFDNFDGNLIGADEEKTCPWIIQRQIIQAFSVLSILLAAFPISWKIAAGHVYLIYQYLFEQEHLLLLGTSSN